MDLFRILLCLFSFERNFSDNGLCPIQKWRVISDAWVIASDVFRFGSSYFSTMTSRLRNQQEDTNYRILRLLQENPNLTQRDLAKALGLSLGGINYCLQALLEKGAVKIHNFQSSTRKVAYAYLLTPSGMAEKAALTGRFLKRKMEEYERIKGEIETLQKEVAGNIHHETTSTAP